MKKLVRDKIPNIVMNTGEVIRLYKEQDFETQSMLLRDKFDEEVAEFENEPCLEELVDIIEVASAMIGFDLEELWLEILKKREQRGRFNEFYVMEIVE